MTKSCRCTDGETSFAGLSTKAIQENIKEIYGVDISPELVSRVTDEVKGLVEEWRNRPLESFYPVVFFDALLVNIRDEGQVSKKAVLFGACDTLRWSKRDTRDVD